MILTYTSNQTLLWPYIPYNLTFNDLLQKITQRICGDHFVVTEIDYFHLVNVVNNKLIHDTVEIKSDNDIA